MRSTECRIREPGDLVCSSYGCHTSAPRLPGEDKSLLQGLPLCGSMPAFLLFLSTKFLKTKTSSDPGDRVVSSWGLLMCTAALDQPLDLSELVLRSAQGALTNHMYKHVADSELVKEM